MLKEFGEFCRAKRQLAEKSQLCAATEIGFANPQMLSQIERGRRCLPISRVQSAAKALNVDPNLLFDRVMEIRKEKERKRVFHD